MRAFLVVSHGKAPSTPLTPPPQTAVALKKNSKNLGLGLAGISG